MKFNSSIHEFKKNQLSGSQSHISVSFLIEYIEIIIFVGLLHHPFWLQLVLAHLDHRFQLFNFLPEMRIWSILLIKSDLK